MGSTFVGRNGMYKGLMALSPLAVFLAVYLLSSILQEDFYKMPLSVAFIIATIWGVLLTKGITFKEKIKVLSQGAANNDVIYMVWVFVLAGAFAAIAQKIGATEATVNFTLSVLPSGFLMPGFFLASCFISMAIGTSVGTVVALTPVAVGIASETGVDIPMFVAIIVGGAFFGDNLSFISDTTIASTRSQGCGMSDKFKMNIWLTIPAALLILMVYVLIGRQVSAPVFSEVGDWLLILPYLFVILSAILGVNVLVVMILGILSSVLFGYFHSGLSVIEMFGFMGEGVDSMGNLIVVTLLASGMLGLVRYNGGIDFLLSRLTAGVKGKRGAQAAISGLVAIVNVCTANNTIAIITVGQLAKDISQKYGLEPRKTASLLDTCSCVMQSILPYGAQVLMAASLANILPVSLIPYLYYPFALGFFVFLSIVFQFPRHHS